MSDTEADARKALSASFGESIEVSCPHCGGTVMQNKCRFEAGIKDPICPSCLRVIQISNDERTSILEKHKRSVARRLVRNHE